MNAIKPWISEKEALDLLTKEIPSSSYEEAQRFDFRAKDLWNYRGSIIEAYKLKVLAARNFERIAQEKNSVSILEEAAFSYDKATKNAEIISKSSPEFLMAAIRCRIRACRLHYKLWKEQSKSDKNYQFASRHLVELVRRYICG